ncbi:MAG: hypothetical protein ABSB40_00450 [Nitrososphaeria archaeon]|jgi:hypothetical protein
MTHTLHRTGDTSSLKKDYVVLVMSCRGFNDAGATPKLVEALKIMAGFNPINMGDMKTGSIWTRDYNFESIVKKATDTSIFHGVYREIETVKKVVKALKEADLGMSVVVSGLYDEVSSAVQEVGLRPHTVMTSLGIWGKTELLPKQSEVLDIMTMCGHGMISRNLVTKLANDVKLGRISSDEAARTIAKCCTCGIFNVERAKVLIDSLAGR